MKKIFIIIVFALIGNVVNAQNVVVDVLKSENPTKEKFCKRVILDPTQSIKDNFDIIKNEINSANANGYKEYSIFFDGRYKNRKNEYYDWSIGISTEKDSKIIDILTELYSISLDNAFCRSEGAEYHTLTVNKKEINVQSGRTFKRSDGKITKEYVKKTVGNTLYLLYPTCDLYKKIREKVRNELRNNNCTVNKTNAQMIISDTEYVCINKNYQYEEKIDTLILHSKNYIWRNYNQIIETLEIPNGKAYSSYSIVVENENGIKIGELKDYHKGFLKMPIEGVKDFVKRTIFRLYNIYDKWERAEFNSAIAVSFYKDYDYYELGR